MATNNSISTDELKSLILQLDSKVTGFSEQILSEVKRGVDVKPELSLSKPEAFISSTQDDNEDQIGSEVNSQVRGSERELCPIGSTQPERSSSDTEDNFSDPIVSEVNSEARSSERELCTIGPTQLERFSSNTEDNCSGESTACAIQNNVLNVHHDTIMSKFDFKSLTVTVPEAEVLQTGDNSQLIINKNDVDFDKFKEEILDNMDRGHKEILDVLINFKDQYNRNTKSGTGSQDEVSKALSFIISEVEKISEWQNHLVHQGVSISYQIKDVFQSVQGSNRSLIDQLSSVNDINENLQSEINSERSCIRRLEEEVSAAEEEKRKLQIEIDHFTANKQALEQQIRQINMARGAIEFSFDISTLNRNVFASVDHLMLSNRYSDDTPVQNETGSTYSGVFGNKPIKPNQDIYFDVDIQYKIKQSLEPDDMIFEVAVTNKMALYPVTMDNIGVTMDDKGWSFGAIACEHGSGSGNAPHRSGFLSTLADYITNQSAYHDKTKVCFTVWRRDRSKYHDRIGGRKTGGHYSGSFRVNVKRSRNMLTIIDNRQGTTCFEFTDLDEDGDLWPSFGVYSSSKVEVVLKLKPLLSYVD